MKHSRFAIGLFLPILLLSSGAGAELASALPAEIKPPEKVLESFQSVAKVKVVFDSLIIEEMSGWFIAPDIVITAAHKNQWEKYLVLNATFVIEDNEGISWPASVLMGKPMKDFAALRVEKNGGRLPSAQVAKIRLDPPREKELLWWQCGAGLLQKKWSAGFFLKATRHPSGGTGYLIAALIGGNGTGCSGSPLFDAEGSAIARISASVPSYEMRTGISGLESGDGNLPNVIVGTMQNVQNEFSEIPLPASSYSSADFPTLPVWMTPSQAVQNNFSGVVEVDLIDGTTRIHASAWLIRSNVLVTAGHFYNKHDLSDSAVVEFKDRSGKLWRATPLPAANNDISFFVLNGKPDMPVLVLRQEPLDENGNELLWWYCASGLLRDEWSMGRFLGQVPPSGALEGRYAHNVYLINSIAGGIHAGCSGAPVMDYHGRVAGFADGFMAGGSLNNIFAIRAEDVQRAVEFAESRRGGK